MSIKETYDVIIIGGGPSGMMAAIRAGERGLRVLLLEKNLDVGKKLSLTGGGRCNILNAEEDQRKLLENYGDSAKFLYSPFSKFGMQNSRDFFESRGLAIKVEARKRAFPSSEKATDVIRILKKYVKKNKVQVMTNVKVLGFKTEDGKIVGVKTEDEIYKAKSFVLATGGSSYQKTGSTGEGMHWLKKLGHTIYKANPSIVPLVVDEKWVKDISGTTLSFIKIIFGADRLKSRGRFFKIGKVLFTHFGLSGPTILNSSHQVKEMLKDGPVRTVIDMYPDTEINILRNRVLKIFDQNKNKLLSNTIEKIVPHGMDGAVSSFLSPLLLKTKVHSVSREDRNKITDLLKAMPLTVVGTMGMDWAVISDGGVDLKEIDMKTMRSKIHNNLYFTGDVLHINRPSGGFSLQLCWTTGYIAGDSVSV